MCSKPPTLYCSVIVHVHLLCLFRIIEKNLFEPPIGVKRPPRSGQKSLHWRICPNNVNTEGDKAQIFCKDAVCLLNFCHFVSLFQLFTNLL